MVWFGEGVAAGGAALATGWDQQGVLRGFLRLRPGDEAAPEPVEEHVSLFQMERMTGAIRSA